MEKDAVFKLLREARTITPKDRNRMFFVAQKNHLHGMKPGYNYENYKKYIRSLYINIENEEEVFTLTNQLLVSYSKQKLTTHEDINSIEDLASYLEICASLPVDRFIQATLFNRRLILMGILPIVFYAFSDWHIPSCLDFGQMYKLAEFSVMSLYRVIPHSNLIHDSNLILYEDSGGLFDIFIKKGFPISVYKVPKNAAAYNFMANIEYKTALAISKTPFGIYIARNYQIIKSSSIIKHDFVEGETGERILARQHKLDREQLASLEDCYTRYMAYIVKKYKLDMHPGNFIWDESERKWYLIDTGTIPHLGAEYYEHSSFEKYYNYVWIDRERQKVKVPIRSLDFGLALS
ncbi:MAG TPA: hypothetical protein DHS36_00585 [Candidatus Veblenbacteria bacterium]|uniref:Uncharacterized protein n=1 Tax=Candidatus Giovannonibacteria bacterium GW2011_GWF2_42_19 TaxID=1618659 RepID=A0A0G1CB09_9BACT|nr:MAG: hypothetical protein UV11_C0023G0004 [Candidatus Giovannonibacteria bacterium GW2011_GWF2_42_19]HCX38758.1 hypothetical protein [Candidatus Veblenbacteria bacterium]